MERIKTDVRARATILLIKGLQKTVTKVENTKPYDAELLFTVATLATRLINTLPKP